MSVVEVVSRSRSTTPAPPATAAWMRIGERRYGLLAPRRTPGNQRLYSPVDETRVRLMQRYLAQGLSPRQAAEQVSASRLTVRPGAGSGVDQNEVQTAHRELREALDRFDETAAQRVLERLV